MAGVVHCFAAAQRAGTTVADTEHILSRVSGAASLTNESSPEARVAITLAHEVGHCLIGMADKYPGGTLASLRHKENNADAFAALWHLANGGNVGEIARLANLRDVRLGYAPFSARANPTAYSVSHDTSTVLRAIAAAAPGMLADGTLPRMDAGTDLTGKLSALADLAEEFVARHGPDDVQTADDDSAFDFIRGIVSGRDEVGSLSLGDGDRLAMERFDSAFRELTGLDHSPLTPVIEAARPRASLDGLPLAGAAPGAHGWAATDRTAEQGLLATTVSLAGGNASVGHSLYLFTRDAAALGIAPAAAADMAASSTSVRGCLPGAEAFGLASRDRLDAVDVLRSGLVRAIASYGATANPIRVPDHPQGTHEVRFRRDMIAIHETAPDGSRGPLDNPIDAAAVARDGREACFRAGVRMEAPYGLEPSTPAVPRR